MLQLDMACAEWYTIMYDSRYSHPGWVEMQNKCSVRVKQ